MSLLYTQWFHRPHYPVQSFAGKTIIVTGGNIGLGKEACKHFTRLGAEKVILASRSLSNGRSAKTEIERETKRANVVEVWELDLSSYASTQAFAKRAETLPRIDAAIMNASVQTLAYSEAEGVELSLTVNVISTFLLAFMLLPLLRASAEKYDIKPVLNIVSSDLAGGAKVPEHKGANVFEVLSDETTANMMDRYPLTKLLQVFAMRELAARTIDTQPIVAVNALTPGFCKTSLARNAQGTATLVMFGLVLGTVRALVGWSAEVGSRNLVYAATLGVESHGQFFGGGDVKRNYVEANVTGEEGQRVQKRVWQDLLQKLEDIRPGVTKAVL